MIRIAVPSFRAATHRYTLADRANLAHWTASAYGMVKDGRLPSIEITPHRWRVSCAGLLAMLGADR